MRDHESAGAKQGGARAASGELSVQTERRTQLLDVTAGVARLVRDSGVLHGHVPSLRAAHHRGRDHQRERRPGRGAGYCGGAGADRAAKRGVPAWRRELGLARQSGAGGFVRNRVHHDGQLELGRWQGIFFCEFDGPRLRELRVKIVPD